MYYKRTLLVNGCSTCLSTQTVAVLSIFPTFVTLPRRTLAAPPIAPLVATFGATDWAAAATLDNDILAV